MANIPVLGPGESVELQVKVMVWEPNPNAHWWNFWSGKWRELTPAETRELLKKYDTKTSQKAS